MAVPDSEKQAITVTDSDVQTVCALPGWHAQGPGGRTAGCRQARPLSLVGSSEAYYYMIRSD
eukprot:317242-Hanusia_phi.AAC.3